MSAQQRIGAVIAAVLIAGTASWAPARALAAIVEPGPSTPLTECSDPDSFGGAQEIGNNRLTVERIGAPLPAYRLLARWGRWDGQDLAASAERELGRTIDWENARLVVRLREDSPQGVTILMHEQIVNGAQHANADIPGGALATVDVEPSMLWPKSSGSVHVKIRVERPGLDLATCWAEIPRTPELDGAARSSGSIDFTALP